MTTKIHLTCDRLGRTLAFVLSGGNVNDCTRFTQVMAAIRVGRPGPGRPRVRPDHVIADKGYSSKTIRADLRRRGIGHTIPERAGQQANAAVPQLACQVDRVDLPSSVQPRVCLDACPVEGCCPTRSGRTARSPASARGEVSQAAGTTSGSCLVRAASGSRSEGRSSPWRSFPGSSTWFALVT